MDHIEGTVNDATEVPWWNENRKKFNVFVGLYNNWCLSRGEETPEQLLMLLDLLTRDLVDSPFSKEPIARMRSALQARMSGEMVMKDFIGNAITPGCFLARGGKGNSACEYGMIAYRVVAIKNGKLTVERLTVDYPKHQAPGEINLRKSTISNPNAVVVITPTPKILQLFEDAGLNNLSVEDRHLVGAWIHGTEIDRPWGKS